ncbi:hypothetical protein [Bacteroides reticulotermitis]|uniref:Uncharacterized protein n=2 Tax=Bacteroides reticulotermitis TaxID=1133319 RepID=W4UQ58_9BACE|nr:hypothetical protein [Bacteroides reticulotermitis]MBB4043792.1 hypothetical protein [Bacteroides reticulotermitis]GAE83315.1 hypothetical protein JCM10512_1579 [Bacteroides reticulotermitis JCM 10512]
MDEKILNVFSELVSCRNWYSGTSINRFQANEIKRRFRKGELSIGRIVEVLIECGYKVTIAK